MDEQKSGVLGVAYLQAVYLVAAHLGVAMRPKTWITLRLGDVKGWYRANNDDVMAESSLRLCEVLSGIIEHHPSNVSESTPFEKVVHPCFFPLSPEELAVAAQKTVNEWYFDTAVDWLEVIGVSQKVAMNLVHMIFSDMPAAKKFLQSRFVHFDPIQATDAPNVVAMRR